MPSNTKYDPVNSSTFEKTKLNKASIGVQFDAALGSVTNGDHVLTDDVLMTGGGSVLVANATRGDHMDFQIYAPDGQGGYVLVKEFVTSWYVDWTSVQQPLPKSIYPAKIPAGFKLRVVYHSSAVTGSTPWIAVNYDLEKVLV